MKSMKLGICIALLAFGANVFGQSVVIDENFQSFKEQGWKNDTVCGYKKTDGKSSFKVSKTYGDNKVEYTFVKAGIAPTCETKKTPSETGVTKGFVEVNKNGGEIIISEQKFISSIEVGASATGQNRGFGIMKSVKGGEWVKVGDYIGSRDKGFDSQAGFFYKVEINESDVALKLVPIETPNKEGEIAFQSFRIHNIKVFGK